MHLLIQRLLRARAAYIDHVKAAGFSDPERTEHLDSECLEAEAAWDRAGRPMSTHHWVKEPFGWTLRSDFGGAVMLTLEEHGGVWTVTLPPAAQRSLLVIFNIFAWLGVPPPKET